MAATDQNYRSQYTLDVVFAASSVLLLISTVVMFVQDYNKEFKHEQRSFRDVESALAQRQAIEQLPSLAEFDVAEKQVISAKETREQNRGKIDQLAADMAKIQPDKERSEVKFQTVKADLESITSFYHIEVEHHGSGSKKADEYLKEINRLATELAAAQAIRDKYSAAITVLQAELLALETPLVEAQTKLKKVTDRFDTQVKLATIKQWGMGDRIRNLPVIDGFAPPLKIHQFTINDIPIDYNFKYVTRYDRCMSCHQGIDRPAYTAANLESLVKVTADQETKLAEAKKILERRKAALAGLPEARMVPDAGDLRLSTISTSELTPARLLEFRAHPRLDLFAGSESKHSAEKFGCTSCHSGQGSATSFLLASHTPNDAAVRKQWVKDYDWFYEAHQGTALWDFPMLPHRFIESSCLKCHHEVTDLVSSNNRIEAPKVVKGYNLIKEFGCYGCHEIQGQSKGRQVGPDLRLEPYPPLEDLTPAEKLKAESDPDNMPGNLRKVGPSLFRLSEKTNREWTANWLQAPREFRPDTKMPHFYGLSNNHPDTLPPDQKKFPDAEISAVTHFLFAQSDGYLKNLADSHKADAATQMKEHQQLAALQAKNMLTDGEKKELDGLLARKKMRAAPQLADLAPGHKGDAAKGRILFSERGCLACHSHQALEKPQGTVGGKDFAPTILTDAQFGPDLSQLKEKLGKTPGDEASARQWLMQWIVEPHVHSPRSRMPVTHLDGKEAADIAAWLLSQSGTNAVGSGWKDLKREAEKALEQDGVFKSLARVYLVRILSQKDIEDLESGQFPASRTKELPEDERILSEKKYEINSLKHYLGKKAVGRLGCYACHDIPGFENAKPIGVGLNEWGKKDPERLAFDDIGHFIEKHYEIVDSLRDKDGKPVKASGDKQLYEKFYADLMPPHHHQREGYLNQKILDPRSYDHNRLRTWDDRSRMPQFKFARSRKKADDKDEGAYRSRQEVEEAEAREAVATFVLGLIAEPVPLKMINQPTGDRLAEVKGRQILDKYNCAGCHLIRPGYFEVKNSPATVTKLEEATGLLKKDLPADHYFPNHAKWSGRTQPVDTLAIHGATPKLMEIEGEGPRLYLRLTEALQFRGAGNGKQSLRAASEIFLPPSDFIYPSPAVVGSPEKLTEFLKEQGPYGGYFANLLTNYLMEKLPKDYQRDEFRKDNGHARASVPPILLGQGERTQTEWLYQFLLNPQPIRQMTILRMPRFNMSKDEAKALVNYFAAVERINNPNLGLTHPYEAIPQQEDLDAPYWRLRTTEYVSRLKAAAVKDGKAKTLYEQRIQELQPVWKDVLKERDRELATAKQRHEAAKKILEEPMKAVEKEKDADKKKALEEALKAPQQTEFVWKGEVDRLIKLVGDSSIKEQQKRWEEREAYVVDGFKLLANSQLCLGCHQVGPLQASKSLAEGRGPPLQMAAERLRPGWLERWVAHPQRYLTYTSVMPPYFPGNKTDFQQLFAGSSQEQAAAVRDVVMIFNRALELPANRHWALPVPVDSKKPAAGE